VVPEAPLERTENGLHPAADGWFVLNVRDARWFDSELGMDADIETPPDGFEQVGIKVYVLRPGEPSGFYHGESAQEDFLVLSGECLLLIEGEERRLEPWDFVHSPPWTEHTFLGAGDGPCILLGVGAKGSEIKYIVSDLALRHGAGVETETNSPREAYARFSGGVKSVPCPPEFPETPG
jgi:uncharacterized cupin superfamily protein